VEELERTRLILTLMTPSVKNTHHER